MKRKPKPGEIWKYKAKDGVLKDWHMLILRCDNPLYLVLNLGYSTKKDGLHPYLSIGSMGRDCADSMEFVQ